MANRANKYPDEVLCPLVDKNISCDNCIENQAYADRLFKEEYLSTEFKQKENWQDICLNCKYFETE